MKYDQHISIAVGSSRRATTWLTQKVAWSAFVEKLKAPVRGVESMDEYMSLPKSEQDELKDVGGFIGGALKHNLRRKANVLSRSLITLDADHLNENQFQDVLQTVEGLGVAYVIYSTRKHTSTAPRLRLIFPLAQEIPASQYEPLARGLAEKIGMSYMDTTTFEASRLMYWPSACRDSPYVFQVGDKPFLQGGVDPMVEKVKKQQHPREKKGLVGTFCRQYDIIGAIDAFLPNVYARQGNRLTFLAGSTTGGAVLYGDGHWLYSHHDTDPCSGKLVNAYDLIRWHKFAGSNKEMMAFARADQGVKARLKAESFEKIKVELKTEDDDWLSKLELCEKHGHILELVDNVALIIHNDSVLKGKFAYDEFANREVVLGALPWNDTTSRRPMEEYDDVMLYRYIEKKYRISSQRAFEKGFRVVCYENRFDDVVAYLNTLVWDGVPRLDTLFIDYLGAEDNAYTRAVARKSLTAAVARALVPGVKYDQMTIFVGSQGIGKGTFLRILGKNWYSDSVQNFEGKEVCELVQGVWIQEVGELDGIRQSQVPLIKQFLSRTEDIFREAYGKRTAKYPRRCVFFGTTNELEFLRDTTGNRRFWPIRTMKQQPTKDIFKDLSKEVDQIYAEALIRWQEGEELFLKGDVEQLAIEQQAEHSERDTREGVIMEFLTKKITYNWKSLDMMERQRFFHPSSASNGNQVYQPPHPSSELTERQHVCAAEIWVECFNNPLRLITQRDAREINVILRKLGWEPCFIRFGPYGRQRGFVKKV